MNEYTQRVARGVRFLDGVKPDWRSSIDLDTLDLADGFNCIIGQVFGSYTKLFFWIGLDDNEPEGDETTDYKFACALGFNAMLSTTPTGTREMELAFLQNAWRDYILAA